GAFAERIQALLDAGKGEPPFVGILSNGTSGDINNVNYAAAPPPKQAEYERIRVVADRVALAAHEAYKRIEQRPWVALGAAQKEIERGARLRSADDVARAREIVEKAKGQGLKTLPEVYARETVLLAGYPPRVRLLLQALRIGDLGIAACPCETF